MKKNFWLILALLAVVGMALAPRSHSTVLARPISPVIPGIRGPYQVRLPLQFPGAVKPAVAVPKINPVAVIIPGAFNPNSPIRVPAPEEPSSDISFKLLFDGAKKPQPVPVQAPQPQKGAPGPSRTLPESDLIREIGI